MKNQIIHTLVISAAILGAGFVIGTIVKDKPQAVTEAKPAPASKQTEPVQVVKADANDELIKELVAQIEAQTPVNDGLKKIITEQNLKISNHHHQTDAYRKLRNSLSSEMRVARIHKENFQMMANYVTHIRKLNFGYGGVPDIGGRTPKNITAEAEFLVNRIKTLKLPVVGPQINLTEGVWSVNPKFKTERKLLVIALEFRLALVQQKLMAHPHPVGGIALRQHKNGRIVPFDGAMPLLESSPPMVAGANAAGVLSGLAGGGAKLDGAKVEPLNNKSNKK